MGIVVQLNNLTAENLQETLALQMEGWQAKNLPTIAEEIALAYVDPENRVPLALTVNDKVIGFMVFSFLQMHDTVAIPYFMIDWQEQNKGYGTKALQEFIQYAENLPGINKIRCVVNTGDLFGRKTLESAGFVRGQTNLEEKENEMVYIIR